MAEMIDKSVADRLYAVLSRYVESDGGQENDDLNTEGQAALKAYFNAEKPTAINLDKSNVNVVAVLDNGETYKYPLFEELNILGDSEWAKIAAKAAAQGRAEGAPLVSLTLTRNTI